MVHAQRPGPLPPGHRRHRPGARAGRQRRRTCASEMVDARQACPRLHPRATARTTPQVAEWRWVRETDPTRPLKEDDVRDAEILVGYDGSTDASAALDWALEEARRSGQPVRLAYVFEWLTVAGWVGPGRGARGLAGRHRPPAGRGAGAQGRGGRHRREPRADRHRRGVRRPARPGVAGTLGRGRDAGARQPGPRRLRRPAGRVHGGVGGRPRALPGGGGPGRRRPTAERPGGGRRGRLGAVLHGARLRCRTGGAAAAAAARAARLDTAAPAGPPGVPDGRAGPVEQA